ncbi:MAG: isocitrate lyase/phosphoenolpyruvate mutase family protein [Gammaproteobacteria bacterium]|nr:isocitrate lyase/phosphoenolpyruvate mutase family protein [Gammaproteobacteria bacterium]
MDKAQKVRGKVFKDLHSAEGIFVMPNAWNAGSACMLEAAGFPAVGTTSAGIAFCLGLPDYEGVLTREAALDETRRIAGAVRIPVSVDAENGYGHTPESVAETIRRVAETGAVGASIEGKGLDGVALGGFVGEGWTQAHHTERQLPRHCGAYRHADDRRAQIRHCGPAQVRCAGAAVLGLGPEVVPWSRRQRLPCAGAAGRAAPRQPCCSSLPALISVRPGSRKRRGGAVR